MDAYAGLVTMVAAMVVLVVGLFWMNWTEIRSWKMKTKHIFLVEVFDEYGTLSFAVFAEKKLADLQVSSVMEADLNSEIHILRINEEIDIEEIIR